MLSVIVHKLTALGNTWEHRLPGLMKDPCYIELSPHLPDRNSNVTAILQYNIHNTNDPTYNPHRGLDSGQLIYFQLKKKNIVCAKMDNSKIIDIILTLFVHYK